MHGTKYIVCIGDGMADYRLDELQGATPLEFAKTPNADMIAAQGTTGFARTIPKGMKPGSDAAHLSIFGYDPKKVQCSRAAIEAAGYGIDLQPGYCAFRFNFATVFDGVLADCCGGKITQEESCALIKSLNDEMGIPGVWFFSGERYKNIMLVDCAQVELDINSIKLMSPYDLIGQKIDTNMPAGTGAKVLCDIMKRARHIVTKHEVNVVKQDLHESPANYIWIWSGGLTPQIEPFSNKFGMNAGMVTSIHSLVGLSKLIGVDIVGEHSVSGGSSVGSVTDALNSLENTDCVFMYVEDADKASHTGTVAEKIKAIELFDSEIIGPILNTLQDQNRFEWRIMVATGQMTPVSLRKYVADPVPFAVMGTGIKPDKVMAFNENAIKKRRRKHLEGHALLSTLFMS